jgi:hypothetical protein
MVRALVEHDGPGNWGAKAAMFNDLPGSGCARSATGLMNRWRVIKQQWLQKEPDQGMARPWVRIQGVHCCNYV